MDRKPVASFLPHPRTACAALVLAVLPAVLVGPGCVVESGDPSAETEVLGVAASAALPGPGEVCVKLQRGTATVEDATIAVNAPGTNYGSSPVLTTGGSLVARTLVKFDVSAIPPNATVTNGFLRVLTSISGINGSGAVNAHLVTGPWSEATVTNASFGNAFVPAPFDTGVAGVGSGPLPPVYFNNVTAVVQGWVNGTTPNHGVLLDMGIFGQRIFRSSEDPVQAARPTLEVCYLDQCADGIQNQGETGIDCGGPCPNACPSGKIVVDNDEWTLSNAGVGAAPTALTFATNIASWFTGGPPGSFLVYSNNFGLTESALHNAMTSAGHQWTISTGVPFTLATLQQYDGVWLAGNPANQSVLIAYVAAGGNVYVGAGTSVSGGAVNEAAKWNTFLNAYGLAYAPSYNNIVGAFPVSSGHPIMAGVSSLYYANGNNVSRLNGSDPHTQILHTLSGQGLIAVYQ